MHWSVNTKFSSNIVTSDDKWGEAFSLHDAILSEATQGKWLSKRCDDFGFWDWTNSKIMYVE